MENKLGKYLPKKNQWLVILLVGVLLIVLSMPTKPKEQDADTTYSVTDKRETDVEIRLENMLEKMQGVGKADVMITFKENEQVEGVLVIADGAKNAVIVRNITEVVQALFEVDSHKIKVIERNQNN